MTKSAARRAIAGGCNARVFKTVRTNSKSLHHEPRTGAFGAGPFVYGNTDVQRLTDFQTDGFAPRY